MKKNNSEIKIAMLGMVEGNGHPYSWSAIVNGEYDEKTMVDCGYPVIPQYLAANKAKLGIPGAKVTHVWTDNPADAKKVSKASCVEHVVDKPEDVIGKVDAVCISTDIGYEHLKRAKPFIDAGIPTFIDKPLADNREDLREFIQLYRAGKPILSSSCMRYSHEIEELKSKPVGAMKLVTGLTCKSWARYGIHALEGLYQLTGPGFISVRDVGQKDRNTVLLKHKSGVDAVLWAYYDCYGSFGSYQVFGDKGSESCRFKDSFSSFKRQLESFVGFVRTGKYPFPVEETFELIAIIAAADLSFREGGREVALTEIVDSKDLPH
jgi:predicted dehydrogenase